MKQAVTSYRLGIDIGGTFTDGALVDEASGELTMIKVLTSAPNPAQGFMEAVERALASKGIAPAQVNLLVHATTIATNAIIEGKIAKLGLITTKGFRDVLEIGYQIRPRLYDLFQAKPKPLVPRRWCYGVSERLDARGKVLEPLDEQELRAAVLAMKAGGREALVISFLHSYLNPRHELRAEEIAREAFPAAHLSVSARISPEFREFPRTSTAAVNAAVMPTVSRYVGDLREKLAARGLHTPFYIMQSNGGVMSAEAACARPVYMLESGPAAGVIFASTQGSAAGIGNIISFDMGGTTAKVGMVIDGTPRLSGEYEVGSQAHSPIGEGKGSGYPVRTAVIDLVEVGAGGGSQAWIDGGGALRVGPQSAGAEPGPACYGRGGNQPTITDANLMLGRLNPDYFLGGELALDPGAATEAVRGKLASPLGLSPLRAAHGVVEVANAGMVAALRLVSVQRGYDPRDFTLVAFGGAGPLHANALAKALEIPTVLIPASPGVASAIGLLRTDIRHEFAATRRGLLEESDPAELGAIFADFEQQATALLSGERERWESVHLLRTVDLRYRGQSHELRINLPPGNLSGEDLQRLREHFAAAHEKAYGYAAHEDAVELVNLRLAGIGKLPGLPHQPSRASSGGTQNAIKGKRQMWFDDSEGALEGTIIDRYRLGTGDQVGGPAVIEEMDSATVVLPGYIAQVDPLANLVISRE